MKTVVIIIGNSDNKLTQDEWAEFVARVRSSVKRHSKKIHFSGGPATGEPRQDFAFVCECESPDDELLRNEVRKTRSDFKQDSAAWIVGTTEFV